jgi:hypothetical protein
MKLPAATDAGSAGVGHNGPPSADRRKIIMAREAGRILRRYSGGRTRTCDTRIMIPLL